LANITFVDKDSGDHGLAVVRFQKEVIALALSLQHNGDLEVFLGVHEVDQLIEALTRAKAMASEDTSA
jgi:hypothetical protein